MRRVALRTATLLYGLAHGRGFSPGLRVLMYHSVGTMIEDDVHGIYNMPPDRFEAQMRYLAKFHRKDLVALDRSALAGESPRIALSFDDGYRDNLSVVAPLLVELGIPFSVFVCAGAVAERREGFLGPEDLRELAALPGVTIGSHGVRHLRLTECNAASLSEELGASRKYLEALLGRQVDMLTYPHGAIDRRVRDSAEDQGYRIGGTSRFDINPAGRDSLLLCRTDIWTDDDLPQFTQKLRGDWDWMRWRAADPARAA